MATRREFLAFGLAVSATALLAGCVNGRGFTNGEPLVPSDGFSERELPVPPLLERDQDGRFILRVQTGSTEIVSGFSTPTWGYNGAMLGPTLRAFRGERVRVRVENTLDEMTTVHWHGMVLPAEMDGGPHQPVWPGQSWEPEWDVVQPAATLWYHPHPHGSTAEQVYRGLAGMFIIDELDSDSGLPSAYGVDDIPLILQDRSLNEDGSLSDNSVPHYGLLGDIMTVNGAHAATFTARRSRIRFRILDGANARRFNLAFSDDREFSLVASDAGLLQRPEPQRQVSISPGERVEIVVDIAPGDNVVLQTRSGRDDIDQGDLDLLRIVGGADLVVAGQLPATLPGPEPITLPPRATNRTFELNGTDEINGREMSIERIDVVVPRGAVELWTVTNDSDFSHNFHVHGSAFTIVKYDGAEPAPWMAGHKDTVFLPPRATAALAVQLPEYVNEKKPYMYHCHLLRHEDKGMMGQFVVAREDRIYDVPLTIPGLGDGHEH